MGTIWSCHTSCTTCVIHVLQEVGVEMESWVEDLPTIVDFKYIHHSPSPTPTQLSSVYTNFGIECY
jgi:hypothetical protein